MDIYVCDETDLTAYSIQVPMTSKCEIMTLLKHLQWDALTG